MLFGDAKGFVGSLVRKLGGGHSWRPPPVRVPALH
jgi:hypothetical protein